LFNKASISSSIGRLASPVRTFSYAGHNLNRYIHLRENWKVELKLTKFIARREKFLNCSLRTYTFYAEGREKKLSDMRRHKTSQRRLNIGEKIRNPNSSLWWNEKLTLKLSGWESEGPGFEPRRLQTTFTLGCQKNNIWFPVKNSGPLMNKNAEFFTLSIKIYM